jgi:hypothetical protein
VPYRTNRKRKVNYKLIFSITKEVVVVAARIQFGSTFLFINISLKSSIELGYGVSGNKSDNKSKMVTAGAHACECVIIVAEFILSLWVFDNIIQTRVCMVYFTPFFYHIAVPSIWRQ